MMLPFGDKAKESALSPGFLTVWEGSVRSMKTVTSLYAWMIYVLRSPDRDFLMTGTTQGSVYRNCIVGDFGLLGISRGKIVERADRNNSKYLSIQGTRKRIYYFGGENVGSYRTFRGATFGGWYADEANKHHRNTIEEGFNRTAASRDRRHFWTMNPDIPEHWIYQEYLDAYKEKQMPGFRLYHFSLDDNPAISEERKDELARQYTGVAYQRYILGLRVRAEGRIYVSFEDRNILSPEQLAELRAKLAYIEIGVDVGGSRSASTFSAMGYWAIPGRGLHAAVIDEHYDMEHKGTEKLVADFGAYVKKIRGQHPGVRVTESFVDSAEQLIIKSMRALGVIDVRGSLKKPILERIRLEDALFAQGRLFVAGHCKHTISAFKSAVWNEKAKKEERLDDGTTNIDSLDAAEYTLERHMREFL